MKINTIPLKYIIIIENTFVLLIEILPSFTNSAPFNYFIGHFVTFLVTI